jgi:phosphoribosylamine--glycine ligase
VKADGLAAGKGVVVCDTAEQANAALRRILLDDEFGAAGTKVIVEERLTGAEISAMAFCDGTSVVLMPFARDHKRIDDNDQGPNTGGMGAYAPVADVPEHLEEFVIERVLLPVVRGMADEGQPYVGVLYAGLMLTPQGVKVLEFNCRFGDPETQAILPLLRSDLAVVMNACIAGRIEDSSPVWADGACASVVVAAPGYPGSYPKGLPIFGLDEEKENVTVYHAGTAVQNGQVVTAGGRVLAVSGFGTSLPEALRHAYSAIETIHFDGMHFRRDIGRVQEGITR